MAPFSHSFVTVHSWLQHLSCHLHAVCATNLSVTDIGWSRRADILQHIIYLHFWFVLERGLSTCQLGTSVKWHECHILIQIKAKFRIVFNSALARRIPIRWGTDLSLHRTMRSFQRGSAAAMFFVIASVLMAVLQSAEAQAVRIKDFAVRILAMFITQRYLLCECHLSRKTKTNSHQLDSRRFCLHLISVTSAI